MLLEAAVALVIVGLIATAALELYGSQLRAAAREPSLLVATALAQDRLAALRLLDPVRGDRVPDSVASGRFAPPFAAYRWHASLARSGIADLYDARVDITWTSGAFTLASRIYRPTATGRSP